MIIDLKLLVDNNAKHNEYLNYNYSIKDGIITCTFKPNNNDVFILFDENICDIKLDNIKYEKIKSYKIKLLLDKNKKSEVSFDVKINNKFLVRLIYDYISEHIEYDELLKQLKIFKDVYEKSKYKKKINSLYEEISNSNGNISSFKKNMDLLTSNELNKKFASSMTNKDVMLLITKHIYSSCVPKIDQNMFNDLVKEAINSEHPFENVWRLGMNYDGRGFNFDLLDDFFVNSNDSWYLEEYVSGVEQVSHEKIAMMLIKKNDKEFIKEFLNEIPVKDILSDKSLTMLEKAIKD